MTPRTKAGRALLERESLNSRSFALITAEAICAIEAEAATPSHSVEAPCIECGKAKADPDHDFEKIVSSSSQPFSVHVYAPSHSVEAVPGLDVERLARALEYSEVGCWATGARHHPDKDMEQHRIDAERIAAEYAALSRSTPEPTE